MFDLLIKSEAGDILADAETEAIAIVYQTAHGCTASSMMATDMMTAFDMVMSLDMLKESILQTDKRLKKMYKRRKRIVRGVTQVDLSMLNALLRNRGDNEDDE